PDARRQTGRVLEHPHLGGNGSGRGIRGLRVEGRRSEKRSEQEDKTHREGFERAPRRRHPAGGSRSASTSARSSGVSAQPAASALARTCSGFVAPAMTEATG